MYSEYWKLREKPFENTPDPRFIYYSENHEEAISRMLYVIRERKGLGMLSGDIGSGKTLISRKIMQDLSADSRYHAALIINPQLSPLQLLREIIYQLGGGRRSQSRQDILRALHGLLYENENKGKRTVVLIDEAQIIDKRESLEELRLLTNFQLNDQFLLTVILLGQPELRGTISQIPQLKQRLSITYHLRPLTAGETTGYIRHRLVQGGGGEGIFSDQALPLIHERAEGLPRMINTICDLSLLIGFCRQAPCVDKGIVEEALRELDGL